MLQDSEPEVSGSSHRGESPGWSLTASRIEMLRWCIRRRIQINGYAPEFLAVGAAAAAFREAPSRMATAFLWYYFQAGSWKEWKTVFQNLTERWKVPLIWHGRKEAAFNTMVFHIESQVMDSAQCFCGCIGCSWFLHNKFAEKHGMLCIYKNFGKHT